MLLSNLDSGQIAYLTLLAAFLAIVIIFIIKPKWVDQADIWLTARFRQLHEQRQTKRAQWKANHPPKHTTEETAFFLFKTGFLTMASSLIGLLAFLIVLVFRGKTGNDDFEPWEQGVAIAIVSIGFIGYALGLYSDTLSPPSSSESEETEGKM